MYAVDCGPPVPSLPGKSSFWNRKFLFFFYITNTHGSDEKIKIFTLFDVEISRNSMFNVRNLAFKSHRFKKSLLIFLHSFTEKMLILRSIFAIPVILRTEFLMRSMFQLQIEKIRTTSRVHRIHYKTPPTWSKGHLWFVSILTYRPTRSYFVIPNVYRYSRRIQCLYKHKTTGSRGRSRHDVEKTV